MDHSKTKGFTIIEVLVSVTIFTVILLLVLANFRAGQFSSQLRLAAQNVVSELRQKQIMTQSGQPSFFCRGGVDEGQNCEADPMICTMDCVKQVPLGGYGLVFVVGEQNITLFANNDTTDTYQIEEKVRDLVVSATGQVEISALNTPTQSLNELQIIFTPPEGGISFAGDVVGETESATITVRHLQSGKEKTVAINKISGRIDVE